MLEKKDFVNLHIAVDEKSKKVVSFRITKGDVYDSKKFCSLVKKVAQSYNIYVVYADKAYDNRRSLWFSRYIKILAFKEIYRYT